MIQIFKCIAIAGISVMQQLKISPSDVEEHVVSIGMEGVIG